MVVGPGPGDPGGRTTRRWWRCASCWPTCSATGRPTLAVCLGHQVLAGLLGLPLHRRDAPYQGLQREVELFGQARRVGFYSTFTARADADRLDTAYGPVELARDPADGAVHALRGRGLRRGAVPPGVGAQPGRPRVLAELLGRPAADRRRVDPTGIVTAERGRAGVAGGRERVESPRPAHRSAGCGRRRSAAHALLQRGADLHGPPGGERGGRQRHASGAISPLLLVCEAP